MQRITPAKAPYHTDDGCWHLFSGEDGALYLLVFCEASVVSYQCLIKLDEAELRDYHGLGWLAMQYLANRINYFVEAYRDRRIVGPALAAAIAACRQAG